MNNFATLEQIPSQFKMTNLVQTSGEPKKDSSCQPSFNYFPNGSQAEVRWGSDKPLKETCPTNFKPHMGTPNHAIWNNSTKRKTIIDRVA